ncbi:MAG TPA: beta-propeller fold lactonase family protein [Polyangiaceae bacterium]|nr:beta-propeller fold lactonase family protein [Polyangiaceae bacterium]
MIRRQLLPLAAAAAFSSSACSAPPPRQATPATHSSSIAISPDGAFLFVAHPDADSVAILDLATRSIQHEILLASAAPGVDPATARFDPAVMPRALALDSTGKALYVTGQRSGSLYAIDTRNAAIKGSAVVCSEPIGVIVSEDDSQVFVACSQDDEIVEIDASSLAIVATVATPRKPWALAWAPDGRTLLATHLLGPGVSELATHPLALEATWSVPDGPPHADPTEPHGLVRGIYDVVARPGTQELWVAHMMLGTDTLQPALAFNDTVFPALSILNGGGNPIARLSVQPDNAVPGSDGAFGDVVSGPRSMAFSDDGKYAFVVDADSEDLLVVDAANRVEATVVRPLPGHLPEGVVVRGDEIYVQERNSEDVVAFKVQEGDGDGGPIAVTQDGAPFKSLSNDPMPATLRVGQKLFYSANSDDVPLTQNHWVACASCHIEGRSDAVTWLFEQGPRDTPTNAGGMLYTGFLFRTADRSKVQDYWKTIDVEQGGHFAPSGEQQPLLDAIAAYVNYAIPLPVPPSIDAAHQLQGAELASLRAQGEAIFQQVGCATCHSGPARTDSGSGNPTLDLGGPVLLHDVGTCVTTGPMPDAAHDDIAGHPRAACAFDTPALRGLVDSAPYLHDGSAATLEAVLPSMLQAAAGASSIPQALSAAQQQALIEYQRSL